MQLTSTTSQNARLYPELQRPGPTTRPGEEDLSDPMHRRTEEHWRGLAGHLAPRDMQAVGKRQPVRVHLGVERGLVYERADGVVD